MNNKNYKIPELARIIYLKKQVPEVTDLIYLDEWDGSYVEIASQLVAEFMGWA